jgi:hypothetical protein
MVVTVKDQNDVCFTLYSAISCELILMPDSVRGTLGRYVYIRISVLGQECFIFTGKHRLSAILVYHFTVVYPGFLSSTGLGYPGPDITGIPSRLTLPANCRSHARSRGIKKLR